MVFAHLASVLGSCLGAWDLVARPALSLDGAGEPHRLHRTSTTGVYVSEPKQSALTEPKFVAQPALQVCHTAQDPPEEVGELCRVRDGQREGWAVHLRAQVDEPAGGVARQGAAALACAKVGRLFRGPAIPTVCKQAGNCWPVNGNTRASSSGQRNERIGIVAPCTGVPRAAICDSCTCTHIQSPAKDVVLTRLCGLLQAWP